MLIVNRAKHTSKSKLNFNFKIKVENLKLRKITIYTPKLWESYQLKL